MPEPVRASTGGKRRLVIIMHCEYSTVRAPAWYVFSSLSPPLFFKYIYLKKPFPHFFYPFLYFSAFCTPSCTSLYPFSVLVFLAFCSCYSLVVFLFFLPPFVRKMAYLHILNPFNSFYSSFSSSGLEVLKVALKYNKKKKAPKTILGLLYFNFIRSIRLLRHYDRSVNLHRGTHFIFIHFYFIWG